MTERPHNAANEESVKERKQKAKDAFDQQQADLMVLLVMPEFRRYLWRHWNETCGLMRSASSANGSIQSQNIGMQDVARLMWAEIEAAKPLAIPQMMQEWHAAQVAKP